jgi:hypothetical protein
MERTGHDRIEGINARDIEYKQPSLLAHDFTLGALAAAVTSRLGPHGAVIPHSMSSLFGIRCSGPAFTIRYTDLPTKHRLFLSDVYLTILDMSYVN